MRARHLRLTAVLTTAAMGGALATPAIEAATATPPSVPALPDLSSLPVSNIGSIISELQALQSTAPGGSLPVGALGSLEASAETLVGGLLSTVIATLNTLLGSNPAAPAYLTGLLTDLQDAGASGNTQAVLAELEAALTTAGLGQLLHQASNVTPTQVSTILQELASLQGLPLGGSVPSGGLGTLTTMLGTIASSLAGNPQSAVQNAITLLGSGSLTPAQLETVIADLQSAAGSAPAPLGGTNGVLAALAAQLADASSIFGGLGSLGSPPSAATVLAALNALQGLASLPAGGNLTGGGGLSQVGSILTTIAGEPGVPAQLAAALNAAAAALDNPATSLSPTQLAQLISVLQSVANGLPSPLGGSGGVVTNIVTLLTSAGTLAGGGSTTTTTTSSGGSTTTSTTGTSTSTKTSSTSSTSSSKTGSSKTGTTQGGGTPKKVASHSGYVRVTRVRRSGQRVSLTLTCTASRGRSCTGIVAASETGYTSLRHRVTLGGGARKTVTVGLRARRGHAARSGGKRRPVIHVVLRSGRYRFARALR
jgi:hypothetical protein